MKKNISQLVIVFVTVLALSTSVMAGGKKHQHRWWNPFGKIWHAIETLQDQVNTINADVDQKLAELNQGGPADAPAGTPLLTDGGPVICPKCYFPVGPVPGNIDTSSMFIGAYLPGARFLGTLLPGIDFSNAYLRGANFFNNDMQGAIFASADLRPWVQTQNGISSQPASVIFSSTNLLNADFSGAEGLEEVTWGVGTTCPNGDVINNISDTCNTEVRLTPRDPL